MRLAATGGLPRVVVIAASQAPRCVEGGLAASATGVPEARANVVPQGPPSARAGRMPTLCLVQPCCAGRVQRLAYRPACLHSATIRRPSCAARSFVRRCAARFRRPQTRVRTSLVSTSGCRVLKARPSALGPSRSEPWPWLAPGQRRAAHQLLQPDKGQPVHQIVASRVQQDLSPARSTMVR